MALIRGRRGGGWRMQQDENDGVGEMVSGAWRRLWRTFRVLPMQVQRKGKGRTTPTRRNDRPDLVACDMSLRAFHGR